MFTVLFPKSLTGIRLDVISMKNEWPNRSRSDLNAQIS